MSVQIIVEFFGTIGFLCLVKFLFPLITVMQNSMIPTFYEGNVLLTRRIFSRKHLKCGDIVICHLPQDEKGRLIVKRIGCVLPNDQVYLLGDNPSESYDSRMYGGVDKKCIVSKFITKL